MKCIGYLLCRLVESLLRYNHGHIEIDWVLWLVPSESRAAILYCFGRIVAVVFPWQVLGMHPINEPLSEACQYVFIEIMFPFPLLSIFLLKLLWKKLVFYLRKRFTTNRRRCIITCYIGILCLAGKTTVTASFHVSN